MVGLKNSNRISTVDEDWYYIAAIEQLFTENNSCII